MLENTEDSISYFEYNFNDFEGYINCINDFYKGKYPYTDYLNRDYLKEKIESGELLLTVAKNTDGKIVGVSGAKLQNGHFEKSVVLTLRCILSDYRQFGIGTEQETFLLKKVYEKFNSCYSVYAETTTNSLASQGSLHKKGFILCGFEMMLLKTSLFCQEKSDCLNEKMPLAVYVSPIKKKEKVSIYAPDEHKQYIENLYSCLGVKVEFKEKVGALINNTDYSVKELNNQKTAEIFISKYDKNSSLKLLSEIEKLKSIGFTLVAFIDMNENSADECYYELKKMNFYFSGIKPLGEREFLIMSNTENCNFGFEKIKVPEDYKKTLSYVIGGKI